jgi:hypothetical protein
VFGLPCPPEVLGKRFGRRSYTGLAFNVEGNMTDTTQRTLEPKDMVLLPLLILWGITVLAAKAEECVKPIPSGEGVAILIPRDLYDYLQTMQDTAAKKIGLEPADIRGVFTRAYELAEALFHQNGGTDGIQA